MSPTIDRKLQRYLDKSEIQDVLLRYSRGVDRLDMELVRSTYHPDAYDDHGDYKGDIDGLIEWVVKRHAHIPQSMHFLGNCLVEFVGDDVALVETYFSRRRITTRPAAGAEHREFVEAESLGRYIDLFERRDGEWRTARRVVAYDAVMTSSGTSPPPSSSWVWGQRDSEDALFRMRDEVLKDRARQPAGGR